MEAIWQSALDFLASDKMFDVLKAMVKVVLGVVLGRLAARGIVRALKHSDPHQTMLFRRVAQYGVLGLFVTSAIVQLGFDISVLLGAAGILSVAIGFASQTSASNIISGLFLLGERPFTVGDVIQVGTTTGEVLSIDFLSVKLRTFDNLYVRIPNETLIKTELTNMKRFPIRRYDLEVGVAYKEDIRSVTEVLMDVADANPLCLEEPQPLLIFLGFGDSSINYQFSVWAKTDNYLALRNSIAVEVKEAFDKHGIEIPFPHRSLYAGSVTEALPIRMVSSTGPKEKAGGREEQASTPGSTKGEPSSRSDELAEAVKPVAFLGGRLPGAKDEV